jgi:uncharacterized repeat protein (TIGR03803 family)
MPILTSLVSFNDTDGYEPYGNVIEDAARNLFGTTYAGGANGRGTVFEIRFSGGSYAATPTTLVNFSVSTVGNPLTGLLADAAGNLIGVASSGGANGDGAVFEVVKIGSIYANTATTLLSFNGTNGNPGPVWGGNLLADGTGDLFGATTDGGVPGYGTTFEVPFSSGSYASSPTTLANFNFTNGAYPYGGLVADPTGNLFGTTS